jgi:pathogenesis-related protein 1
VWKATTDAGCAFVDCTPDTIFSADFGSTDFHVCEYFPPGNVLGEFG